MEFLRNLWEWLAGAAADTGHWLKRRRARFAWMAVGAAGVVAALVFAVLLLPQILGLFAPPLDMSQDLYAANRPIAISFMDQDGDVVGHRGAIVGQRLTLKEMPAYLPAAFIAMEDRSFWSNPGIDIKGLLRAAYLNMKAGHVVAGGSTITQQVAKIVFTDRERTLSRKWNELWDAAALNKSLSKTQILELYLNRIYLGSGAYGVDGAAHVYFGKSARDLTLPEAAMLATLTRAPSAFSPRKDLEAAQRRTRTVLKAMVQTGAITQAQAQHAEAHPARIVDRTVVDARNYYFDTAADEAKSLIKGAGKAADSDLVVHTMFNTKIQDGARKAVAHVLGKQGKKRNAHEAAVVVMKPDGAVVAMIGGRDYDDSVFNRATQAHRQPGSSFKPFVYLAALEEGVSPWDLRTDHPVDINGWTPTNYGNEHFGTITVADALAHSVNTITAELAQQVGITTVVSAARRCGITSPLEPNASLALGTSEVTPYEMTAAYTTFANGGMKAQPYLVTEVDDARGDILYRRTPPKPRRVIAGHVDRDLTAMLYEVTTEGTGRKAALKDRESAGKTGTTQDYHDAWFMGFTTDYVTGVWVGNDDSSPMKTVTGGSLPAEIWHATMTTAEKGLPAKPLDKSPAQPPNYQDGDGVIVAGSGDVGSTGNFVDTAPPPPPPAEDRSRGFWDWLFGRDQPQDDSDAVSRREERLRRYDERRRAQERSYRQYGNYGAGPDEGYAAPPSSPPPRQVPHYRWRSDPRWQQIPPRGQDQNAPYPDDRQYGVDRGDGPQ